MKPLHFLTLALLIILGCQKDDPAPPPTNGTPIEPGYTFEFTDAQTGLPIENAYVLIAYGNMFSQDGFTDSTGKIKFDIDGGYILNDLRVTKTGYCKYEYTYPTHIHYLDKTIQMNHPSYVNLHVQNVSPPSSADYIEIYYPDAMLTSGNPPLFYTGQVNTTNIIQTFTGNIGISYSTYAGATYLNSGQENVTTIADDTIDVYINY